MSRLVALLALAAAVLSGVAYWVAFQMLTRQPIGARPTGNGADGSPVWRLVGAVQRSAAHAEQHQNIPSRPGFIDLRHDETHVVAATSTAAMAARNGAAVAQPTHQHLGQHAATGSTAPVGTSLTAQGPPRFGRGSKAQRREWVLPPRVVQSGVACDAAHLGDLTVRAASIVGPGHRCQEPAGPRQDAYSVAVDPGGSHFVAAVADGVSSSRFAEVGAEEAASTAARVLLAGLGKPGVAPVDPREVFAHAAQQMSARAAAQQWEDADVCAALITAVVPASPAADRTRHAHLAWVGDASAWVLRGGRWVCVAGDQKNDGPLASNEVYNALPFGAGAVESVFVGLWPGDVLVLVTDGVGDGLAALPELREYLATRWQTPIGVSGFLDDVGYDAQQFLDDRTAVAIWVADSATSSSGGAR